MCASIYMYKYNSKKKNFEMTRQDFCALQDTRRGILKCVARLSSMLDAAWEYSLEKQRKKKEQTTVVYLLSRKKSFILTFILYQRHWNPLGVFFLIWKEMHSHHWEARDGNYFTSSMYKMVFLESYIADLLLLHALNSKWSHTNII